MNSKAYIPLLLMGTTLLMTTACSENLMADLGFTSRGDKISFTVNTEETLEETTRGATQAKAVAFEGTQPSRPLYLSAEVTQRPAVTRGTRIEDAEHLQSFGVSAIRANENVSAEQFATATPDFFYNLKAERNTSDVFEIAEDFYWPSTTDKLFFYAYTPYDDKTAGNKVQISDADAGGAQKVSFTVDTDVANQVDLMTASAETTSFHSASGSTSKSSVGLDFKHELTAIRFVIGEQWLAGNIKSVGIYNVHGVGTMTIGADDASKWVWKNKAGTDVAATDDFVLTVDKIGVTGTEGEQFIDNTSLYFLMIPQSFDDNDDAYVEVKYQDNSYEYTVTAPLKGQDAWVRNTTVTYAISSHELTKLKIGSIQWPSNTEWKGPKTAFVSGDEVGLYVVDEDGTYLPHKNVRCTYNGSSWTVHHPENNPVYMLPGQQYFFYYPYTPTPDTTYPVAGQGTTNTAATDFFSHLISGWTPAALQNDAQGTVFKAQDLQVGKASVSTSVASTINATMAHQMNLAIITLGQKTINKKGYNDAYKHLSTDANYKWLHSSTFGVIDANYNITASSTFGGDNRPWKNTSNNKYYFVFKPVVDLVSESGTDIEGLQSDNVSADWTENFKTTDVGKGFERTAQSTRTEYVTSEHKEVSNDSYTMATGDVLYADGAMTHYGQSLYPYSSKKAIGIVFMTTSPGANEPAGWTHGYAMALSELNNGISWSTTDVTVNAYVTSYGAAITNFNGYSETLATKNAGISSSFPAAWGAWQYTAKDNSGNSVALTGILSTLGAHWFLGSSGHWFKIITELGGIIASERASDDLSNQVSWRTDNSNTRICRDNINRYLNHVISGGYTLNTSVQRIPSVTSAEATTDNPIWDPVYTTSTEYSNTNIFTILFGTSNDVCICAGRDGFASKNLSTSVHAGTRTASLRRIRPVIGF